MAVSSVGIGSGLDVESIVSQLVALEKQPIKTLEAKATVIESKISTYGEIKSLTDSLNAAVRDLTLDRTWNTVKISSSSSSTANATMTGSAAAGSYNVDVVSLAQSQTSVSTKFAADAVMGTAGVMRVQIGDPQNPASEVKTVDLSVSETDTLQKLAEKINGDATLSKTVIASVITDSAGQQQLMVRARATGESSQFAVSFGSRQVTQEEINAASSVVLGATVTQDMVDAHSKLTLGAVVTPELAEQYGLTEGGAVTQEDVDKHSSLRLGQVITQADVDAHSTLKQGDLKPVTDGGLAQMAATGGFKVTQPAQNAHIKLNGVELESDSNSFAETIPGLAISVSAVGKSLLTVTQDKDAIQSSIQKFVDAYNALNDLLTTSTKYTEETKAAGVLQGDSSTVSLQNALRMLTQGIANNATGAFNRLSDAGISMQQGGKLNVDATKLATALNDVDSLKDMFAAKSDTLGNGGGIAVNFKTFTDELLAYEGTLNNKTDSLEKQIKLNKTEVEKVETRAETVEARLRKQYTALDVKMASLGSLSSYVEQMVASWNKSKD